jgi:hypothetical protein
MTYSLRWPRLAVMVGFLIVAIGWVGYTAIVWSFSSAFDGQNRFNTFFGIFSVVGYAVLAAASWSLFRWMENCSVTLIGMTRALRLFALGNLFLAAGLAAIGYYWSNQAVTQPYNGRTTPTAAASIAFWGAASEVGAARPDSPQPEVDLVAA